MKALRKEHAALLGAVTAMVQSYGEAIAQAKVQRNQLAFIVQWMKETLHNAEQLHLEAQEGELEARTQVLRRREEELSELDERIASICLEMEFAQEGLTLFLAQAYEIDPCEPWVLDLDNMAIRRKVDGEDGHRHANISDQARN